jgi:hypothetical protein
MRFLYVIAACVHSDDSKGADINSKTRPITINRELYLRLIQQLRTVELISFVSNLFIKISKHRSLWHVMYNT